MMDAMTEDTATTIRHDIYHLEQELADLSCQFGIVLTNMSRALERSTESTKELVDALLKRIGD
jgi:hypothetical protein